MWRGRPKGASSGKPICTQKCPSKGRVAHGLLDTVEGQDVNTEEAAEHHRLCLQIGLLGQGAAEGYLDHEFPAKAKSIDGLEGAPVKKGQETLIELTATQQPQDDEDAEVVLPDAPRCHCGRRARCNLIRVPGAAAGRPYFRCAGQGCRLLSFGGLGSSPQAQRIRWLRFDTGRPDRRHIVVGLEHYRPEDARYGHEVDASNSCFVDALAVLAERPALVARLLPNVSPGGKGGNGCHQVRLCLDGRWQSLLVDERLPVRRAAGAPGHVAEEKAGRNAEQELAFGRAAGNQIWLPLIEKAYAKAFGAYDFAFPGVPLEEFLADLTGAFVEVVRLQTEHRDAAASIEHLWSLLRYFCDSKVLVACSTCMRFSGRPSVHALLDVATHGDRRAVRLRNPRVGFHALAKHEVVGALRGTPAEDASQAYGSFWLQFPEDFLEAIFSLTVCHAALSGGTLAHTKTLEGDFTPDKGLGVRDCATWISVDEGQTETEVCLTLVQPVPKGARLLRPAMGRVLDDLGIVVLDEKGQEVHAAAFGGAWRDVSHRVVLQPGCECLVFPISFRAWSGPVALRIQATQPVRIRSPDVEALVPSVWRALLNYIVAPSPQRGLSAFGYEVRRSMHSVKLPGNAIVHVVVMEFEGAVLTVIDNTQKFGILIDCSLQASHMVVHTSRGAQFGEWLEEVNAEARSAANMAWDRQPDWRSYSVEDVVPAASRQFLCITYAVARQCWAFEFGDFHVAEVPKDAVGPRPAAHPFAPRAVCESMPTASQADSSSESEADEELRLALEVSLVEANAVLAAPRTGPNLAEEAAGSQSAPVSGGRWSRRARLTDPASAERPLMTCAICSEAAASPTTCCRRPVCTSCARHWAAAQVLEDGAIDLRCAACSRVLSDHELPELLDATALRILRARLRDREQSAGQTPPQALELEVPAQQLARLGIKRCPSCGTGMQKETESCHKMICRTCRARFCFRCLARLEYFNCGCSGSDHRFVDPVDGRIVAHQ